MQNPERKRYPPLTQAEIRAIYADNPTLGVRRLVWEIYCLHVVVKTAGAVIRARGLKGHLIPGGFDYVLDELARVLDGEVCLQENLPSLHIIHEKRRYRYSTKKRNQRVFRHD